MSNLFASPAIYLVLMGICFFAGVLIGLRIQRKSNEEEIEQRAFQAGHKQGVREGDAILSQFKGEMAEDLGTQLGAMRNGMIETIKAYQQAVSTCGERLSIPFEQRKAILPPVEPEDISDDAAKQEPVIQEDFEEEAEAQPVLKAVGE